MVDYNSLVKIIYYDTLNGKVKYNGHNIEIYNMFVNTTPIPSMYILIDDIRNVEETNKCSNDMRMQVRLIISTRFYNNSSIECDKIAGKVMGLLAPDRLGVMFKKNSNILSTTLINDNSIRDYDSNSKTQIIERILTFEHYISQ